MKFSLPLLCSLVVLITADVNPRQATPASNDCFLVISDIHLGDASDIKKRNAGEDIWTAAQAKIRSILSGEPGQGRPRFIICLGDIPGHQAAATAHADMPHIQKVLTDLRQLTASYHIPLFYVPGNNDSPACDYAAFDLDSFRTEARTRDWPFVYTPAGTPTKESPAIEHADAALYQLGCYSAWPLGKKGGIRIIVLNSTQFLGECKGRTRSATGSAELDWLGRELRHTSPSQHVIIAMHEPPGDDGYKGCHFWIDSLQNRFLDTVDKYKDRISGLLSSHTHEDGFRKLYNADKKFTALLVSCPAIAPGPGNNPSIKTIWFDRDKGFEWTRSRIYYMPYAAGQPAPLAWKDDRLEVHPGGGSLKDWAGRLSDDALADSIRQTYSTGKPVSGIDNEIRRSINVYRR
jgi:sphingomyelin phosphodiesterase acid-like 3